MCRSSSDLALSKSLNRGAMAANASATAGRSGLVSVTGSIVSSASSVLSLEVVDLCDAYYRFRVVWFDFKDAVIKRQRLIEFAQLNV